MLEKRRRHTGERIVLNLSEHLGDCISNRATISGSENSVDPLLAILVAVGADDKIFAELFVGLDAEGKLYEWLSGAPSAYGCPRGWLAQQR